MTTNKIMALVLRCQDAEKRVAELEAERAVLAKGVLAAREGMAKGWTDEAVMDAFHAALKLAKEAKP
jgi:hypothetical protein